MGGVGRGVVSLHVALLSLRLETQDLAQAFIPLSQPMEAFYPPSQLSKIEININIRSGGQIRSQLKLVLSFKRQQPPDAGAEPAGGD